MASSSKPPYRLNWQQGQHILIAGRNGTGKTTLLRRLLATRKYSILLDSKHENKWRGFRVTGSVATAVSDPPSTFRPRGGVLGELDVNILLAQVYKRGGHTLGIDEIYALGGKNFSSYPEGLVRLLTRGRSRGISVVSVTQRPVFCPRFCFTEPVHIYVFALDEADATHLAKSIGNRALAEPLTGHDFLYYNKLDGTMIRSKLARNEVA